MKRSLRLVWVTVFCLVCAAPLFAQTAVEGSAEDLFWTEPMTIHDFRNKWDQHNIGVAFVAFGEQELFRVLDGLIDVSVPGKPSLIRRSVDIIDTAYHKLPNVWPRERIAQLFDALQIRQFSIADARVAGVMMSGQGLGGVSPIMQVRIYRLFVFVEDVIYDVDDFLMWPVEKNISLVKSQDVEIKSVGYLADGIGVLRWSLFKGIQWLSKEIVQLSKNGVTGMEELRDAWIRHRRTKQNEDMRIYAQMPVSVFHTYSTHLRGKGKESHIVLVAQEKEPNAITRAETLSDSVRIGQEDPESPTAEVIISVPYRTWREVPDELKQYVVGFDEVAKQVDEQTSCRPSDHWNDGQSIHIAP